MTMSVKPLREAGLEAWWGRIRSGAPAMFVRLPAGHPDRHTDVWWLVDARLWDRISRATSPKQIVDEVANATCLGHFFNAPL